jgi:peptidoglycan hydrolase-like protein with peptidoglycan-binding domain
MIIRWPKDNEQDLIEFYGAPKAAVESQLVNVTPPFRMTYAGDPISGIKCHRKCAQALSVALNRIWDAYGRDQAAIDRDRVSIYDGVYNPRKIAGSDRWSNHAFAAAIDIDGPHNGFNTGHGTMPQRVIDAFKSVGARWGGDYKNRTDPMHFEFCGEGIFSDEGISLPPIPPPPSEPTPPVLQAGSRGLDVRKLQELLFVDGIFGAATEDAVITFQKTRGLDGDGIVGHETWRELLKWADQTPPPAPPTNLPPPAHTIKRQTGIVATVFGGAKDVNKSAYTGKVLNDSDVYIALPWRIAGDRPLVRVINPANGRACNAAIEDIGPWNIDDNYPAKKARPFAETCYASKTPLSSGPNNGKVPTNDAGIDLSPAAARALGIEGKGKVDWEYVDRTPTEPTPTKPLAPDAPKPAPASWADFDIWGWLKGLFK